MNTKLISITQPRVEHASGNQMSPEDFIVYQARVSNPDNQFNMLKSEKLIKFLITNGHWSPFDMVHVGFEVTTSRVIAAQILRHWSFRFQEFSQRYAVTEFTDYSHVEIREKAVGGNRQGSGDVMEKTTKEAINNCEMQREIYDGFLLEGASPETARMVLPLATLTKLYVTGSVRSWMTYFWQRCAKDAQKEHRKIALEILELFCMEFPIIGKIVKKHKPQITETQWI